MTKKHIFHLNILLLQEAQIWVAQCLDYDIVAHGKTIPDAMSSFERVFAGQVVLDVEDGKAPLDDILPAPIEYWKLFENALRIADKKRFNVPEEMDPAWYISATAEDLRIAT